MEIYQKYYIYCSECGKEEEGLNTSYYTAELNFKGKGWQEIEGYNLCPKCVAMINKEFKNTTVGQDRNSPCVADSSGNKDSVTQGFKRGVLGEPGMQWNGSE